MVINERQGRFGGHTDNFDKQAWQNRRVPSPCGALCIELSRMHLIVSLYCALFIILSTSDLVDIQDTRPKKRSQLQGMFVARGNTKVDSLHAYCECPDVVLCGNKADLDDRRIVTEWRAREMAEKHGLAYIETSAATGQNVSRAVETLLDKVMVRMETAVDRAMLPGRRGRPKDINDVDLMNPQPAHSCNC